MTDEVAEQEVKEVVADAAATDTAKPEDATDKAADAARERGEDGKFVKPVQPRIDELTRKFREQERETSYWRNRAEEREREESAAADAKAAEKPTPDKFDTYDAYIEALTDWKTDQKVNAKLSERDAKAAERAAVEKRTSTWAERAAETAKELPDYHERMANSTVQIAPHVTEILLESEIGPRVGYHLDQNPELADKLNAMTPTAAAREIGRLEATLSKPAEPDPETVVAETAAVTPKKAPPPPAKPLGSVRNTTTPLAKTGMDDYIAQRKTQGARWAR